jgi:outer membrane protein OmpA-like peptidoglycan-associated protein
MKKRLLLFAISFCLVGFAQSQEKALKQYGFWDNWFIQGQAGVGYTVGEPDFDKLISPTAALSVGKYFSPQVGARLQLGGWESKAGWNYNDISYKWNYGAAYMDALFNLNNIFGCYKENRAFNLIGILGVGYIHGFKNLPYATHKTNSCVARVGLQPNFRLNEAWDFNIEFNANGVDDKYNSKQGTDNDFYFNLMVGFTYKFKNRGFELVKPYDEALVSSLNNEINQQREAIESLKANPKTIIQKETVYVKDTVSVFNTPILFTIGKSVLDKNQDVYVYNVAQYLKENPNVKVNISGYADANTGSKEFNQKISLKRAQAVADALTQKYNIPADRIKVVEGKGDSVQPYPTNNWNRVVICVAD